jgi:phosphatidylserine decarboxylase
VGCLQDKEGGGEAVKVARGGANWVLAPIVLGILMVAASVWFDAPILVPLSAIPLFVALLLVWFFRDPERPVADGVASPADGKVLFHDPVEDDDVGPADRLVIFMSPNDVHVNRIPLTGDVISVTHRPGGHIPAFSKESERNERVETILATEIGRVKVVQIAGAVARRIVPYIAPGQHVEKGQRMGLIRLGSRCDLLVPRGSVTWQVQPGQHVKGAATQIATLNPPPSGTAAPGPRPRKKVTA